MHIRPLTRTPSPAETTLIESAILLLFTVFFRDNENFETAYQNLAKFYEKTP
ncbi:MAG: hypothetical protein ACLFTT_07795 [Candidatus Hydrogenedentota bacterium]